MLWDMLRNRELLAYSINQNQPIRDGTSPFLWIVLIGLLYGLWHTLSPPMNPNYG